MNSEEERFRTESIKWFLKMLIVNDNSMTAEQKQIAIKQVDDIAIRADALKTVLRAFGFQI